ncbi:MAG: hypothetical protein U9R20_06210 [Thermodesulfobacteriota bacterium]|nr:hypothetical protein [Thermodesulfobacteriota bacterium]
MQRRTGGDESAGVWGVGHGIETAADILDVSRSTDVDSRLRGNDRGKSENDRGDTDTNFVKLQ